MRLMRGETALLRLLVLAARVFAVPLFLEEDFAAVPDFRVRVELLVDFFARGVSPEVSAGLSCGAAGAEVAFAGGAACWSEVTAAAAGVDAAGVDDRA
jgi:hypothetical protein